MKYWLFVFLPFMASAQQADELFSKLSQKFKKIYYFKQAEQRKVFTVLMAYLRSITLDIPYIEKNVCGDCFLTSFSIFC